MSVPAALERAILLCSSGIRLLTAEHERIALGFVDTIRSIDEHRQGAGPATSHTNTDHGGPGQISQEV